MIVDFYEQVGYLPEAIINYLALLGWSLDDKTEHFSREELIENFSLERVNKAPASFDPKKLWAFQDRHMQQLPLEEKVERVVPYLERAGLVPAAPPSDGGHGRRSSTSSAPPATGSRRRRHPGLRLFLRCRRQARLRREGGGQVAAKARRGRAAGQVSRSVGGGRAVRRRRRWSR